jgi:beta-glucosidase-like glycosyl hydrolase
VRKRLPLGPVVLDPVGLALTDDDRRRLQHPAAGGVILFAHNFENSSQLTNLVSEIKALRTPELFICVDHEGGRVQRFREGFTGLPPMRQLGVLWERDREKGRRCAQAVAYVAAAELAAHGVDFSFAPVLDLDYGGSSVIGDRALHYDPNAVGTLAAEIVKGFAAGGMKAVGKHFPGHRRFARRRADRRARGRGDHEEGRGALPRGDRRGPRRRDARARDLPQGRRRAGRLLEILAAGGAAQEARLRRAHLQR